MAAPPGTLEALVRDELRGPVSEIVRRPVPKLVAEVLNGSASTAEMPPTGAQLSQEATSASDPIPDTPPARAAPTSKTCRVCGETKPAGKFDRGRRVCRTCRGRQEHQRRRASGRQTTARSPTPAPVSTGSGIERWLIQSNFAVRNGTGLELTEEGAVVAAALEPIFG